MCGSAFGVLAAAEQICVSGRSEGDCLQDRFGQLPVTDAHRCGTDIEPATEGGAPATPGSWKLASPNIQMSEGWIETGPEDFSGAFQDCEIGEFLAGDLVAARAS